VAERVEMLSYRPEVIFALRAAVRPRGIVPIGAAQRRGAADPLLVRGDLAVEHAQRILLGAAVAVLAEECELPSEPLAERLPIPGPAVCVQAADRVDDEPEAAQRRLAPADSPEQRHHHLDRLGVDVRVLVSQDLDADLVELPLPALLGPFAPKHRSDVVEPVGSRDVGEPMLDERADDGSRHLRAQRHRVLPRCEGVHLLPDDVRGASDPPGEQLGWLEDRRSYLPEAIAREQIPDEVLDPLPGFNLPREDVARPAYRLESRHMRSEKRVSYHDSAPAAVGSARQTL